MSESGEALGIIGGSGLYEIEGLESPEWHTVDTPWGTPSSEILTGILEGRRVAFLPRHGRGHFIPPSSINYRANIDALKRCGVREVLSVSACGSLSENIAPGECVIIDQFLDRTRSRENSFFGTGCVGHVSLAFPICERLADAVEAAARASGGTVHRGGTYVTIEGPQFSTLAESRMYRETLDCTVIGMTNMPEARLAREAELCYATAAMVTDYDCWHPEHGEVDLPSLLAVMHQNVERARETIRELCISLPRERESCPSGCEKALDFAIMTSPEARDADLVAKLDSVAGRVLR